MRLRSRWNRVDAEHWAHWLLATQTFGLVLLTLWTFAMTLAHGLVLLTLVSAALVALSGWLTAAWRKERQWAWYVWPRSCSACASPGTCRASSSARPPG